MDFIVELQSFWQKQGFKKMQVRNRNLWLREDENKVALVDIIPERLPGQPELYISQMEAELDQLERNLIIRYGKKVDRLTLMLCQDLPEEDRLEETMNLPNVWWLDRKHGRIFIYENQRADFLGLRSLLEEEAQNWSLKEKQTSRMELKKMLQPVTVSIVLLNIFIFSAMNLIGDINDKDFLTGSGVLSWDHIMLEHQFYRLFTAMFLHFGPDHLFQNMLVLMLTGSRLERAVGKIRYLYVYIGSGLVASLASVFLTLRGTSDIAAGASGAIFGVMGALTGLILISTIRKERSYYHEIGLTGIIFMVVCSISYGLFNSGVDNAAHFGGFLGGIILGLISTAGL